MSQPGSPGPFGGNWFLGSRSVPPRILSADWIPQLVALDALCMPQPWSEKAMGAEFTSPYSIVTGIVESDHLVAYAVSHLVIDEAHLLRFGVHPDFRQRGIGAAFLAWLSADLAQRGAIIYWLEVRTTNVVARTVYEADGWKVAAQRNNYYKDTGEAALIYCKKLESQPKKEPEGKP